MSSSRPDGSSPPSPAAPAAAASASWGSLDALSRAAFALEPVPPHERRGLCRPEAAALLDRLLVRVARGRGALDLALAEGLAALADGDRLLRLGSSCLADYGRERLGVAGRTAQALSRLGRELRTRPLLRAALRSGAVSLRHAQAVLPLAVGEAEAAWVERAGRETVRGLEAAVREELRGQGADPVTEASHPGAGPCADGDGAAACASAGAGAEGCSQGLPAGAEAWRLATFSLSPAARARWDEALELAGRLLGPASPPWQRVEAICQEYLGAHAGQVEERDDGPPPGRPEAAWRDDLERALEEESRRWAFLDLAAPVKAPRLASLEEPDALLPRRIDGELRELCALRDRWDELVGHLGLLLRSLGLWRDMMFRSFSHYCRERLGLPVRSVEQRMGLERRLWELPALRQALRQGRLGYERARLVAEVAGPLTVEAWIGRAEELTSIALRREIDRRTGSQERARGEVVLRMPERVAALLAAALRVAREVALRAERRWIGAPECLERVAEHFVATWGELPGGRSTPQRRARARDGGSCQVPGCSRAAAHAHHVVPRARGGGDEPSNLVALCAAHHLHGVHRGWVRVRGRAPDALVWELGEPGPEEPPAPPPEVRPAAPRACPGSLS